MKRKMNKKGFVFTTVAMIGIVLVVIYLMLHLPFTNFIKIKNIINYFIIVSAWLLIQVAFIFGYFKLGEYIQKGLLFYRNKLRKWDIQIKHFLISQK